MARPRTFDETRVVCAVRDEFWDKGYAATSIDDLLRVSGLGKGSLYGAFGDKSSLFLRVLREYDEQLVLVQRERLSAATRAVDVLRDYLLDIAADPTGAASRRGCLLSNSAAELAGAHPEVAAEARRGYGALTAVLTEAVERAQREGDVEPGVAAEETARALLAARLGLIALGRSGLEVGELAATARTTLARLLSTMAR